MPFFFKLGLLSLDLAGVMLSLTTKEKGMISLNVDATGLFG